MVTAVAGRRVDAPGAEVPRFSAAHVDLVRERIRTFLIETKATAVVGSAACGADLLVLTEAGALGIPRRVVLPFGREQFRESSVVDRPGDWGRMFDAVMDQVEAERGMILSPEAAGDDAYAAANGTILATAVAWGRETGQPVQAVLVWNGVSRGEGDLTEAFGEGARKLGIPVMEIRTLL